MSFSRRASIVAAGALLVASATSHAEGPTDTTASSLAPARRVLLVVAGDVAESEAVAQVARELLARLQLELSFATAARIELRTVTAPATADPALLARAWIDLTDPAEAALYVLDPRHDRLLSRRVPRAGGELAREALGHILETTCEGLLTGASIGDPRDRVAASLRAAEAPPPPPLPPPPATEPRLPRFELGAGYRAHILGAEAWIVHGPGLVALVRGSLGGHALAATVEASMSWPVTTDSMPGAVRLQLWAGRALGWVERCPSPRLALRLGVGGGMDVVHVEPRAVSTGWVMLAGSRTLVLPIATAALAFEIRVARRAAVSAALLLDIDTSGTRYSFMNGDTEHVVLRPWPVRPGVAIGWAFP